MQVNGTSPLLYRVKAVAEILDVHPSSVYRLAESGRLHSVRVGFGSGALRIPANALEDYLVLIGAKPASGADEEAIA